MKYRNQVMVCVLLFLDANFKPNCNQTIVPVDTCTGKLSLLCSRGLGNLGGMFFSFQGAGGALVIMLGDVGCKHMNLGK